MFMAFTNTQRRSASFGVVTSLPDDVIDSLWFIIDHFLKNVFELEEELEFQLLNNEGTITFHFSSQHLPTSIDFDFNHPFDPLYPPRILVLDMDGKETILLPEENDLFKNSSFSAQTTEELEFYFLINGATNNQTIGFCIL